MEFWNDRYRNVPFAYGAEPNEFLAAEAHRIPMGRVLCLAEGEGRNAVHLARLGYEVVAVDLSPVGLERASRLARENNVAITTHVADLSSFPIEAGRWQGIVSIWAHVTSAVRAALHRQVVAGLVPGGVLILEAYTLKQLETKGVGGPSREHDDRFMSERELREELRGLSFELIREIERPVNEGRCHCGTGAVVQVVGVKGP